MSKTPTIQSSLRLHLYSVVQVTPTSNTPRVPGILGLGPNSGSSIHASLNNQSQGDTVLDRIFRQNISAPNILTVLLGRSNDPAEKYPGDITVGEILQGLENITSQPRVPVTALPALDAMGQHWQVLLDEDGIIGPNGQPIQVQSRVQSTQNRKQLTAMFDTGFSFPQVPQCVKHISTFPLFRVSASSSVHLQTKPFALKGRCLTRYILASLVHHWNPWKASARYGLYLATLRLVSLSRLVARRILCTRLTRIPTMP